MPKSRDIQLKLRLLAREKREWAAAARKAGIPLAVWIREACERRLKEPPFKIVLPEQPPEVPPTPAT